MTEQDNPRAAIIHGGTGLDCDCGVTFDGLTLTKITLCPLHAAAPALLEALEGFCVWIETQPAGSTSAEAEYDVACTALKELEAARGEG